MRSQTVITGSFQDGNCADFALIVMRENSDGGCLRNKRGAFVFPLREALPTG